MSFVRRSRPIFPNNPAKKPQSSFDEINHLESRIRKLPYADYKNRIDYRQVQQLQRQIKTIEANKPQNLHIHLVHGMLLERLNESDAALKHFEHVITHMSRYPTAIIHWRAHVYAAQLHFQQGNFERSKELLEKMVSTGKKFPIGNQPSEKQLHEANKLLKLIYNKSSDKAETATTSKKVEFNDLLRETWTNPFSPLDENKSKIDNKGLGTLAATGPGTFAPAYKAAQAKQTQPIRPTVQTNHTYKRS